VRIDLVALAYQSCPSVNTFRGCCIGYRPRGNPLGSPRYCCLNFVLMYWALPSKDVAANIEPDGLDRFVYQSRVRGAMPRSGRKAKRGGGGGGRGTPPIISSPHHNHRHQQRNPGSNVPPSLGSRLGEKVTIDGVGEGTLLYYGALSVVLLVSTIILFASAYALFPSTYTRDDASMA
jgi:hypothetical protein